MDIVADCDDVLPSRQFVGDFVLPLHTLSSVYNQSAVYPRLSKQRRMEYISLLVVVMIRYALIGTKWLCPLAVRTMVPIGYNQGSIVAKTRVPIEGG